MTRSAIFITSVALVLSGWASTLPALTLEDCLRKGKEKNLELRAERAKYAAAVADRRSAIANFLPQISASGVYTRLPEEKTVAVPQLSGFGFDPHGQPVMTFTTNTFLAADADNFTIQAQATQPLFTSFQLLNAYRGVSVMVEAARDSLNAKEIYVDASVRKAFYGALLARRALDVTRESLGLAEERLSTARAMYEAGQGSYYDRLEAETQLLSIFPQVIQASNATVVADMGLALLVGEPIDRPLDLQGELVASPRPHSPEDLVGRALSEQAGLKAIQCSLSAAEISAKLARAGAFPSVAAAFNWNYTWYDPERNWYNAEEGSDTPDPTDWNLSLILSVPVSEWVPFASRSRASAAKARAGVEQVRRQAELVELSTKMRVRQLCLSLVEAERSIGVSKKSVELAQEGLRIMQERYAAGQASAQEMTQAEVGLRSARLNEISAHYRYITAEIDLDLVVRGTMGSGGGTEQATGGGSATSAAGGAQSSGGTRGGGR